MASSKNKARLKIYKSKKDNLWRWRLSASSDIIADSAEGYSSKAHAVRAAQRLFEIILEGNVKWFR